MDVKMTVEINDESMKIVGNVDDNGNAKTFERAFKLSNKRANRLEGDSLDYHVLANAAKAIKNVRGMVCEIGTRRGGSLKVIVDALLENQDYSRNVVCIDPYGNIDYPIGETEPRNSLKLDYTNDMRNEALTAIYEYMQGKPVNVVFMCLEDTEFFKRYGDGVPFYSEHKIVEDTYALVFFDGPHHMEALDEELAFFQARAPRDSVWVFDDLQLYPHDKIEEILFQKGWKLLEKTERKASYQLVG